jgi:hypothetical protein
MLTVSPAPLDVLCNPSLSESEKRRVLLRLAFQAYVSAAAYTNTGDSRRGALLDELIEALVDLEEAEVRRISAQRQAGRRSVSPRDPRKHGDRSW